MFARASPHSALKWQLPRISLSECGLRGDRNTRRTCAVAPKKGQKPGTKERDLSLDLVERATNLRPLARVSLLAIGMIRTV